MHKVAWWAAICISICISLLLPARPILATETTQSVPRFNEIYPNAPGSSELGFEFIELYNPSSTPIELNVYQIKIKDKTKSMTLSGSLEPGSYRAIVTTFSLVNSGETAQLWLQNGVTENLVEEVAYTSGALDTESWSLFDDGWDLAPVTSGSVNVKYPDQTLPEVDVCPATPGLDTSIPEGYIIDENGVCVVLPPEETPVMCDNMIRVNEVFSDPVGLEANGGEYIELYNSGSATLPLVGCELRSSKSSQLLSSFTVSDAIAGGGYYLISLSDKITNSSGNVVLSGYDREDIINYSGVTEGMSSSYFETGWELTNQPTPAAQNIHNSDEEEPDDTPAVSGLADCGAGKYRSPETNRCRNITTADAVLTPCDPGQYRNPETNRCRSATSAPATLAACAPGQQRNLETNRCRKVSTASSELKPCQDGYERNPETNRCRKTSTLANPAQLTKEEATSSATSISSAIVLTTLALAGGYAVYEYRSELAGVFAKVKNSFMKGRPLD